MIVNKIRNNQNLHFTTILLENLFCSAAERRDELPMLESKRRAMIFIGLSLILALTAGFLVLQKVQKLNTDIGTVVRVYVASEDVSSRMLITPDNIKTEEIPKKYLRDYHITNVDDLVNKVSVVPLSEGDIITKSILKQASSVIEENNRLITLMKSERVFFDEPLEALDRVDFIVSDRFSGKEETRIFLKDVKVARVAKKDDSFEGIQVEIPLEQAPELIHMQNYADSLRIIKANVGKEETAQAEETATESSKVETQTSTESPSEEPKKEEPSQSEPSEERAKKDTTEATLQ